jgi:ABC-type phosphate transport system substrate-binding protein
MLIAIGALMLPAAVPSLAAAAHQTKSAHKPATTAVTVKGPRMLDWHTINPNTGTAKDYSHYSSVTVSDTKDLTNQTVTVSWKGFTPSNTQGGFPYYQYDYSLYPVMVVECRGEHPKNYTSCWQATNYQEQFGSNSNAQYTLTAPNGSGNVQLEIQNLVQNNWLGCDSKRACSIAVIPSQGGNPNSSHPADCADHSDDTSQQALGEYTFGGSAEPCAWAKAIVIPLTFGPVESCGTIHNPDLDIAGSALMTDAMAQWDTGLCRSKDSLTVAYNSSVGEPTAIEETVQDGLADVALTTRPATSVTEGNKKFVYAPIGVTAASMVYWFDNPNTGQPYTQVRLDQRLVAKLLTTSYTDYYLQCSPDSTAPCDKAVNGNPGDLFTDKEFTELNPKIQQPDDAVSEGLADVPIVLGGESDMTYEVTRWIAGNKAAAAFLKGAKAPGGMHVNTRYKGIKYPIEELTSRDSSYLLQAAYTPVATLSFVTAAMLENQPPGYDGFQPVTTGCPPHQQCFNALAGEEVGQRAMFGITDEADAATFEFPTAAIQNGDGKYVYPTLKTMAAALKSMTTAKNGVTQEVNLDSKVPDAYPLTMVVYALVPISGVSKTKAADIAEWLNYVVGPGQAQGELPGKLPYGYLPLPASMRAQARAVATEVADQSGDVQSSPSPTATPTSTPTSQPSPTPTPSSTPSATSSATPAATPTIRMVALRRPPTSGMMRYALPVLLILAGLAALLGASIGTYVAGPDLLTRVVRRRRAGGPGSGPGKSRGPRRRSGPSTNSGGK